ncbi:sensory neuron membrane protein 1-like isoform X2 [Phymastichus coffea]|uniref:sensory neuron membrane protein 1-like isoform X2 n=1 Tax=Phymastichus coffea TaxID=108790 RepID=UPI00273B59A0|nr:sensory neuron membrane protein 1-like isoform X2 [Phymastichus coffea]
MPMQRSRVVGLAGLLLLATGVLTRFALTLPLLKYALKRKLSLRSGWPMRELWSKLPFVIENHVYVFNVTNPAEVERGAKPIVREVGPFVYDTFQEKVDQADNEKDDTLSYVLENTYFYNRRKSNGLSDELEVFFPHLFILGVAGGPLREQPSQASFTSRAIDAILGAPRNLFYKLPVRTLLFDGLPIPCAGVDDYFGRLICNEIRDKYAHFLEHRGEVYYASLFGFRNGSSPAQRRVRIARGSRRLADLGRIVEVDGAANLSTWRDDRCDAFAGTDGTIFPPLMSRRRNKRLALVYPAICRRLSLVYEAQVEIDGLKLLRYTGDLGTDGQHTPEDRCYCAAPRDCLRRGVFELYKCLRVPIVLSNPHFYLADPYYLTAVDGLHPDKELHQTRVDLDPLTGSPVRAHVRAQFNMQLMPVDKFRLMRNYSYAMLPLVWTDEIVALPDLFVLKIKIGYLLLRLVALFQYAAMAAGSVLCLLAAFASYAARRRRRAAAADDDTAAGPGERAATAANAAPAGPDERPATAATAAAGVVDDHGKYNIARLLSAIRPAAMPPTVD